jgi:hypothetical protein
MATWRGPRPLTVVTACLNAAGVPDFTLTEVMVTPQEYADGVHCDRVEGRLLAAGYEEPFLHFDELDAPPFLLPAVRDYLGRGVSEPTTVRNEDPA